MKKLKNLLRGSCLCVGLLFAYICYASTTQGAVMASGMIMIVSLFGFFSLTDGKDKRSIKSPLDEDIHK